MVLPLGPSKFYGSSLPRPRIYSDLKFNSERVDPPMGVTAPFLSWAADARWSMGGLSLKRKRMAGKIEGSAKKLRNDEGKDTRNEVRDNKEEEKEKQQKAHEIENENRAAKSDASLESPEMKHCSPDHRSPVSAQVFKPKWAVEENKEDCPLVVQDSPKEPGKNRSPKVRIQGRKLVEAFDLHFKKPPSPKSSNAVSSNLGRIRPGAHSMVRSALNRQTTKITQAYDYVPVPDKIMQMPARRVSPRKNSKENKDKGGSSSKPARFETHPSQSIEGSTRRSSRILTFSPAAISKGPKKVVVSP